MDEKEDIGKFEDISQIDKLSNFDIIADTVNAAIRKVH